eukprot:Clim_evm10s230 gene=Clim_evmTU10s230
MPVPSDEGDLSVANRHYRRRKVSPLQQQQQQRASEEAGSSSLSSAVRLDRISTPDPTQHIRSTGEAESTRLRHLYAMNGTDILADGLASALQQLNVGEPFQGDDAEQFFNAPMSSVLRSEPCEEYTGFNLGDVPSDLGDEDAADNEDIERTGNQTRLTATDAHNRSVVHVSQEYDIQRFIDNDNLHRAEDRGGEQDQDSTFAALPEPSIAPPQKLATNQSDLQPSQITTVKPLTCFICCYAITDPGITRCCVQIACLMCLHRWVAQGSETCPHCRQTMNCQDLIRREVPEWVREVVSMLNPKTSRPTTAETPLVGQMAVPVTASAVGQRDEASNIANDYTRTIATFATTISIPSSSNHDQRQRPTCNGEQSRGQCANHPTTEAQVYCHDCRVALCLDCALGMQAVASVDSDDIENAADNETNGQHRHNIRTHDGHRRSRVEDAGRKAQTALQRAIAQARRRVLDIVGALDDTERRMRDLQVHQNSQIREVQAVADHSILRMQQLALQRMLEMDSRARELRAVKDEVQDVLIRIEDEASICPWSRLAEQGPRLEGKIRAIQSRLQDVSSLINNRGLEMAPGSEAQDHQLRDRQNDGRTAYHGRDASAVFDSNPRMPNAIIPEFKLQYRGVMASNLCLPLQNNLLHFEFCGMHFQLICSGIDRQTHRMTCHLSLREMVGKLRLSDVLGYDVAVGMHPDGTRSAAAEHAQLAHLNPVPLKLEWQCGLTVDITVRHSETVTGLQNSVDNNDSPSPPDTVENGVAGENNGPQARATSTAETEIIRERIETVTLSPVRRGTVILTADQQDIEIELDEPLRFDGRAYQCLDAEEHLFRDNPTLSFGLRFPTFHAEAEFLQRLTIAQRTQLRRQGQELQTLRHARRQGYFDLGPATLTPSRNGHGHSHAPPSEHRFNQRVLGDVGNAHIPEDWNLDHAWYLQGPVRPRPRRYHADATMAMTGDDEESTHLREGGIGSHRDDHDDYDDDAHRYEVHHGQDLDHRRDDVIDRLRRYRQQQQQLLSQSQLRTQQNTSEGVDFW